MKTKNLFSALAVMLALASCSKETAIDQNPDGNPAPEAKDVVTNFKISIASGSTKNGGAQVTPLPEESALKSLTILVFKDESDDLSLCPFEAALTLTEEQLKEVPVSAKILTSAGKKIVVAYANSADIIGYGKPGAYSSYQTFMEQKFPAAEMSIASATKGVINIKNIISENDGFMMVSDESRITVEEGKENAVPVRLNRMTSKVQMKAHKDENGDLTVSGQFSPSGIKDHVSFGTPTDMIYTPSIYQQIVGISKTESGPDGGIEGSTYIYYDSPATMYPEASLWKKVNTFEDEVWSGDALTSAFITENMITPRPQNNNTTCVVVRVPVTFKTGGTYTDGTPVTEGQGKFWVVCKFQNETVASNATNGDYSRYDLLDKIEPYQGVYGSFKAAEDAIAKLQDSKLYGIVAFDSYSYFRINLSRINEAAAHAVYSVPRNSFYAITVDSISSFGWPTPEGLTDGDQTEEIDDKRLGISANVEVAPWTVYEQDETLE